MPALPQHDPNPSRRAAALEASRATYRFSHHVYDGLALAAEVPAADHPPAAWSDIVNRALRLVLANDARADRSLPLDWRARLGDLARLASEVAHGHLGEAVNDGVAALLAGDQGARAATLDEFGAFFQTLPRPALLGHVLDDVTFAERYLRGADPEILRAWVPADGFEDAVLQVVSPGDTLARAQSERRSFVADYGMLTDLPANALGGEPRQIAAPVVLLVTRPGERVLRPAAIRLVPGGPVFVPTDGWGWALARLHAAVADTLAGAIWFHHARTHLVAEPIFVGAWRSLAPNHPVRVLLAPHAVGTLYINHVGSTTVFAEHGLIDWIAGTTRAGVRDLARRSVASFRFDDQVFPEALARRGVDEGAALGAFPYRDDGLLVWAALADWVADYLALYYADDAAVDTDGELQAWVREVGAVDGGGIRGFGEAGRFRTRAGLGRALTQLVFSVSAQHSAMNFPVSVEMTVVPNSPFAAYRPPPTHRDGWTEADWLATLPPLDQAQRQFGTALLLGESRFGQLGAYPEGFEDPAVGAPLTRFRDQLARVEATITARNREREPYVHLLPSRIAPSISI